MEQKDFNFTIIINGTRFIVNLKQADGAKMTFEELIKSIISNEAQHLKMTMQHNFSDGVLLQQMKI